MKLIILLFLFLSQVLIIAQVDTTVFFPLEIGNRWDFIDHEWDANGLNNLDTLVINIYSDTLINNHKYFRINDNSWIYDFIRTDSVGIYYYDTMNNKEWLFYKFNLPIYEFILNGYHVPSQDTSLYLKVYKSIDDSTVLFNKLIRRIGYTVVQGIDAAYGIKISPQFGFLEINASNFIVNKNIYISGCKISGVIYGTLTAINEKQQFPDKFQLFQNYPNPFNPETSISYQLLSRSFVTLKVFDVLGKEVATLINEEKPQGNYTVSFNASKLSSGIYFYTIRAGKFHRTKKMVLLR